MAADRWHVTIDGRVVVFTHKLDDVGSVRRDYIDHLCDAIDGSVEPGEDALCELAFKWFAATYCRE